MKKHTEHCPACKRVFKTFRDYPRLQVLTMERLPIPEAVDRFSGAAAERELARRRARPEDAGKFHMDGINMTPAIARLCETAQVRDYLAHLEKLAGQEVAPRELLPPLKPHGYFRGVYPVGDTGLCIALSEAEAPAEGQRWAELEVYCDGPNLGSAGGPTLQSLGVIARLSYRGLLAPPFSSVAESAK